MLFMPLEIFCMTIIHSNNRLSLPKAQRTGKFVQSTKFVIDKLIFADSEISDL